jgi:hypothetical protein
MSTEEKNAYELLDVALEATDAEIRKAYRTRSLKIHPDKVRPPAVLAARTRRALTCSAVPRRRTRTTPTRVRPFLLMCTAYTDAMTLQRASSTSSPRRPSCCSTRSGGLRSMQSCASYRPSGSASRRTTTSAKCSSRSSRSAKPRSSARARTRTAMSAKRGQRTSGSWKRVASSARAARRLPQRRGYPLPRRRRQHPLRHRQRTRRPSSVRHVVCAHAAR